MQKSNYELSVLVKPTPVSYGRPVKEYGHRGLTFIEGRKNQPYTIRFRNNSARKCLAVVSIDGIDVVDGKPATNESRGYIVPAYASVEIKGWRTSTETVNDFVFTTKPEGYSAQSQQDDSNSGVISVKVFDEQFKIGELTQWLKTVIHEHHHHHHHYPSILRSEPFFTQTPVWCGDPSTTVGSSLTPDMGATYACCTDSGQTKSLIPPEEKKCSVEPTVQKQDVPDFNLGTGWGDPRQDSVNMVDFNRGIELCSMDIYYSDAEGLAKSGIEVDKKPAVQKPSLPKGFNGFCVPPKVTKTTA